MPYRDIVSEAFIKGFERGIWQVEMEKQRALEEQKMEELTKYRQQQTELEKQRLEETKQYHEQMLKQRQAEFEWQKLQAKLEQLEKEKKIKTIEEGMYKFLKSFGISDDKANTIAKLSTVDPRLGIALAKGLIEKPEEDQNYQSLRTIVAVDPQTKKTIVIPILLNKQTGKVETRKIMIDKPLPSVFRTEEMKNTLNRPYTAKLGSTTFVIMPDGKIVSEVPIFNEEGVLENMEIKQFDSMDDFLRYFEQQKQIMEEEKQQENGGLLNKIKSIFGGGE